MSEAEDRERVRAERLILDLLDTKTGGRVPAQVSGAGSAREFVEVLGLLPRALPEVLPGLEVKNRILEAVAREDSAARSGGGDRTAGSIRARRAGWLMPLAASVALAMIAVTGWLVIEVRGQRLLIAELSSELESARSMAVAFSSSQAELAQARSRLAMATTQGAEFCALAPPEGSPAKGARGVVVMHEAREEWFLRIEGLAACPAGHQYVVWFATPEGRFPGPAFAARSGEAVELTIPRHPEGIRAIMITLESEPAPEAPSMEPLLFGNERAKLL